MTQAIDQVALDTLHVLAVLPERYVSPYRQMAEAGVDAIGGVWPPPKPASGQPDITSFYKTSEQIRGAGFAESAANGIFRIPADKMADWSKLATASRQSGCGVWSVPAVSTSQALPIIVRSTVLALEDFVQSKAAQAAPSPSEVARIIAFCRESVEQIDMAKVKLTRLADQLQAMHAAGELGEEAQGEHDDGEE